MRKPSRAGRKPAKARSSKASKLKRNIVPKAAGSAMQQTSEWLETLGLGQYAAHFAENETTVSILPDLTDADLKELGVYALGHRRILLRAIAELIAVGKDTPKPSVAPASPIAPQPYDSAERRFKATVEQLTRERRRIDLAPETRRNDTPYDIRFDHDGVE